MWGLQKTEISLLLFRCFPLPEDSWVALPHCHSGKRAPSAVGTPGEGSGVTPAAILTGSKSPFMTRL